MTYLAKTTTFEEASHSNEPIVIVPCYRVFLVVVTEFERVLKDCKRISRGHQNTQQGSKHTFETFSTRLLEEVFLPAVVRNGTRVILDGPKREHLELLTSSHDLLIKRLERGVNHLSFGFGLNENCSVLSHLRLLHGRWNC
jgi:hypothetical protein